MTKTKIFLASSNELKSDRDKFEKEIGRKNKVWVDKGISLHLDLWEDLSAAMPPTRSQDEYNKVILQADIFVLLIHTKVGIYSEEEFDTALEGFRAIGKPKLIVYFNEESFKPENRDGVRSLWKFEDRLKELGYFPAKYKNSDDLWNQFNKELDRILVPSFENPVVKYGNKNIPKVLGGFPIKPSLFIGRDNNTSEIHDRLSNNDNMLLLVNGKGGIGKTTMASQYYFDYADHYAHLIWLVSEKGIKDALISLAISLRISFQDDFSQTQQLEAILRSISELKKPVLLIIDNANDINDLDKNFRLLRQIHNVHILITSRINNYQNIDTYDVKHLDKKSANELFKFHFKAFKSEEQALLDKLLEAIGYNTLVIELMAKNLNEFNTDLKDNYPLKNLLEDIQGKGVLAIRKSTKVNADYKLQNANPEDIIRTMYDVS